MSGDPDTCPIPLCDLKAQYQTIEPDIQDAIQRVLQNGQFIKGPDIGAFERGFASLHKVPPENAIGCSNGTSALTVALKALGLGTGDEVILPSHTFFATVESVLHAGCTPVFADINVADYTIDPDQVAALIGPATRAILPVHIYGAMADMAALQVLVNAHGLFLVEDAAQAHLASRDGMMAGATGDAASFSFYPGKNLGAYGDAGLAFARDPEIAKRIRKLIDHGRSDKYLHDMIGDNLRMDTLQAAILNVKLEHLADWTARRREIAGIYDKQLKSSGFKVIETSTSSAPAYHLYIVEIANRDDVMVDLKKAGIASGIHYPVPVHKQPAIKSVSHRCGDLSVTERIADRIISLPIYPEMSSQQIDRVMAAFLETARTE